MRKLRRKRPAQTSLTSLVCHVIEWKVSTTVTRHFDIVVLYVIHGQILILESYFPFYVDYSKKTFSQNSFKPS